MLIKEAKKIIISLSQPDKMPGYAYGLPAWECKTGGKLAKVPGSVCFGCYAMKGNYTRFPAMARVLLIHADWLRDNGHKLQAVDCRAQAASLTRKFYCRIGYYKKGKITYVNKRS